MHRASGLWQRYLNVLQKSPWRTWTLQTGAVLGTGDVISQIVVDRKEFGEIDVKRTARFTALGMLFVGPSIRGWYVVLERMFGNSNGVIGQAMKKMVTDQFMFAPVFVGNMIVMMGLVQQQPFHKVWNKLNNDYNDLLRTNLTIWPAVQTLNFYLVPLQHRILMVNGTLLIVYSYLMWFCNNPCVSCPMKVGGTSSLYILDEEEAVTFKNRNRNARKRLTCDVCINSDEIPCTQVTCRDVPFPNRKSICYEPDMPPEPEKDRDTSITVKTTGEKIKSLIPKIGNVAGNVLFRKKNEQPEYDECCRLMKPQPDLQQLMSEEASKPVVTIDQGEKLLRNSERKERYGNYVRNEERRERFVCGDDTRERYVCDGEKRIIEKPVCVVIQRDNCMKFQEPKTYSSRNTVKPNRESPRRPNVKCIGKPTCPRDNIPREKPICTCGKDRKEKVATKKPSVFLDERNTPLLKQCQENQCSSPPVQKPDDSPLPQPSHSCTPRLEVTLDNNNRSWPLVSKLWWIMQHPFRPAECVKKSKSVPECSSDNDTENNTKCMLRKSSTPPVSIFPQLRSPVCTCKSPPRPICTCKPRPTCSCKRNRKPPPPPKPPVPQPCIKKPTCPLPVCTQRPACPCDGLFPTLMTPALCIQKETCPKPPPPPEPPRCPPLKQECIRKKTCPKPCIQKPTCPPPKRYPVECSEFCFREKTELISNVFPPEEETCTVTEKLSTVVEIPSINIEIAVPDSNRAPYNFQLPSTFVEFSHMGQEIQVYSLLLPQTGTSAPSVAQAPVSNNIEPLPSPSAPYTAGTTSNGGGGESPAAPSNTTCDETAEPTTPPPAQCEEKPKPKTCPPPPDPCKKNAETQKPPPDPPKQPKSCNDTQKSSPEQISVICPPCSQDSCDQFFVQEPSPPPSIYYESQTSSGEAPSKPVETFTDEIPAIAEQLISSEFSESSEPSASAPFEQNQIPDFALFSQQYSETSVSTGEINMPFTEPFADFQHSEPWPTESPTSMPSIHSEVPDSLPSSYDRNVPVNLVPQRPGPMPPMYSEAQTSTASFDFREGENYDFSEFQNDTQFQPLFNLESEEEQQQQLQEFQQFGPISISTTPGSRVCSFPVPSSSQTQIHLTVSLSPPVDYSIDEPQQQLTLVEPPEIPYQTPSPCPEPLPPPPEPSKTPAPCPEPLPPPPEPSIKPAPCPEPLPPPPEPSKKPAPCPEPLPPPPEPSIKPAPCPEPLPPPPEPSEKPAPCPEPLPPPPEPSKKPAPCPDPLPPPPEPFPNPPPCPEPVPPPPEPSQKIPSCPEPSQKPFQCPEPSQKPFQCPELIPPQDPCQKPPPCPEPPPPPQMPSQTPPPASLPQKAPPKTQNPPNDCSAELPIPQPQRAPPPKPKSSPKDCTAEFLQ